MDQPTELELKYLEIYQGLCALAHTFERRPPETDSTRGIFLRRAEKLALSYDTFVSPKWKEIHRFDTTGFLRKIKSLDYSTAS